MISRTHFPFQFSVFRIGSRINIDIKYMHDLSSAAALAWTVQVIQCFLYSRFQADV